jgi:hypothetical protein
MSCTLLLLADPLNTDTFAMKAEVCDPVDSLTKRNDSSKRQLTLHQRLDQHGLHRHYYKWCKAKDLRHITHNADQKSGYCPVCKESRYTRITIKLDCNYEPTELLQRLNMNLSQEPMDLQLPEGLRLGHIVVPSGSIVLAPRAHGGGIESLKGEDIAEIPIRCGTVEEIVHTLYCYYSVRLKEGVCIGRWMRGLLKVSERLYTPNIC